MDGFIATTRSPVSPVTTKRASSPRSFPPLLPLPSWIPPSRVRWAVWALSTAADSQLGPAAGRSSRRITSWSTSSSSASFRALPSGVSCPSRGCWRHGAREGGMVCSKARSTRSALSSRSCTRCGRSRPPGVRRGPGTSRERGRGSPACARARTRPRKGSPPPAATAPTAGPSARAPARRGACRTAAGRCERRVRAMTCRGSTRSTARKASSEASRRRCALSVIPGSAAHRRRSSPGPVPGGSRSSSARVWSRRASESATRSIVEVLGGGHLSAHLVERVRGRRATRAWNCSSGRSCGPNPVRQPLLELSRVPEEVRIPAVTQGDQRHPGCGHRTRGGEHHCEHPAANRNHVNPPLPRHLQALACSSQKASNESADPRQAMV